MLSSVLTVPGMILRMGVAILTSGVIGFEREYHNRPAGLRTHILVGLGASIIALVESYAVQNLTNLQGLEANVSIGRMTAQVISGIGFLGAGTILVNKRRITGLTTAASLWNVACLGIAAGYGYISLCLIGAGMTFIVLSVIRELMRFRPVRRVEIVFKNNPDTFEYIKQSFRQQGVHVREVDFSISQEDNVAISTYRYTLDFPHRMDIASFFGYIGGYQDVIRVRLIDDQ